MAKNQGIYVSTTQINLSVPSLGMDRITKIWSNIRPDTGYLVRLNIDVDIRTYTDKNFLKALGGLKNDLAICGGIFLKEPLLKQIGFLAFPNFYLLSSVELLIKTSLAWHQIVNSK